MLFVDIARLLLDMFGALLGVTLLLRAYMNWVGMPSRNQLAQFAMALTDWIVRPLRRLRDRGLVKEAKVALIQWDFGRI